MRIVYVEDNAANVALVQRICNMSNDDLLTFGNADDALSAIYPDTADLILMDINLGNYSMNGLELTGLLRQKGVQTPIVIVTAYDASGYPEQFKAADFNELVPKPVSIRGMIDLFDNYRTN
jgi:CheY-like chemotaxis protein